MEMNLEKMGDWEVEKALYVALQGKQLRLADDGAIVDVNQNSGNVYAYYPDEDICLYMPINCELQKEDIYVIWSDPEDGEEFEVELGEKSKDDIERYVKVWRYLAERKQR